MGSSETSNPTDWALCSCAPGRSKSQITKEGTLRAEERACDDLPAHSTSKDFAGFRRCPLAGSAGCTPWSALIPSLTDSPVPIPISLFQKQVLLDRLIFCLQWLWCKLLPLWSTNKYGVEPRGQYHSAHFTPHPQRLGPLDCLAGFFVRRKAEIRNLSKNHQMRVIM
jgi:hypothetical protein